MAAVGMAPLALFGTVLAVLAVSGPHRSGWAVAALILNALVLAATAIPLLVFVGPTH